MNVALIDYGAGNVPSVERALSRLGVQSRRVTSARCLSAADVLILPGVGHFAALIRALDQNNLRAPLAEAISRGVPFLGICLGLHALYEASDEAPALRGLALLPGQVCSLPAGVKLPHMGWNQLHLHHESKLLRGIPPGAHFYFAHSFALVAAHSDPSTVATCTHGVPFIAVVEHQKMYAVQFHPEKSGAPGARLLRNFLDAAS